jgi:LmbE family N-acetylglucosaminyl deacetylase
MPDASAPDGPLLIVSPHLDDAALSCAALLDRGAEVTVLDVFTLVPEPDRSTEWDRRCGFASAREAMAAREEEESAAFAGTRHEVLAVDLLDGQYRDDLRDVRDERRFRDALLIWVEQHESATVVLPVGAGLTPGSAIGWWTQLRAFLRGQRVVDADTDHLWVRDTALAMLRDRPEVTVWLYEEIPHRWSRSGAAMAHIVGDWADATTELVVIPVDRARKAERLAQYRSQLPVTFRRAEGRRLSKRIPADERYWIVKFEKRESG